MGEAGLGHDDRDQPLGTEGVEAARPIQRGVEGDPKVTGNGKSGAVMIATGKDLGIRPSAGRAVQLAHPQGIAREGRGLPVRLGAAAALGVQPQATALGEAWGQGRLGLTSDQKMSRKMAGAKCNR